MSVLPNDLLKLAKDLLSQATAEVQFRNVVSRTYYAAYHSAKHFHDALPQPGKLPGKPTGIHEELAHRLCWPSIPESDVRFQRSREIGRDLRWLHSERTKADYRLDMTVTRDSALEVMERAEQLIAKAISP